MVRPSDGTLGILAPHQGRRVQKDVALQADLLLQGGQNGAVPNVTVRRRIGVGHRQPGVARQIFGMQHNWRLNRRTRSHQHIARTLQAVQHGTKAGKHRPKPGQHPAPGARLFPLGQQRAGLGCGVQQPLSIKQKGGRRSRTGKKAVDLTALARLPCQKKGQASHGNQGRAQDHAQCGNPVCDHDRSPRR